MLRRLGVKAILEEKLPQYVTQIQFKGVISPSRKWGLKRTYGASICENLVQGIARDFLVEAMLRLDGAGYPITIQGIYVNTSLLNKYLPTVDMVGR